MKKTYHIMQLADKVIYTLSNPNTFKDAKLVVTVKATEKEAIDIATAYRAYVITLSRVELVHPAINSRARALMWWNNMTPSEQIKIRHKYGISAITLTGLGIEKLFNKEDDKGNIRSR